MKTLLSVGLRFSKKTQRAEMLEALRDAGWMARAVSPVVEEEKFLEFHKGDDHAFVYEDEVLFGRDEGGGAGYRRFEDAVWLIRAN